MINQEPLVTHKIPLMPKRLTLFVMSLYLNQVIYCKVGVQMKTKKKTAERYAITVSRAWSLSKEWNRSAIIWRTLDHVFSIGSFALSIITVYIAATTPEDQIAIILLSSFAAILTLTGFACNPNKYVSGYRLAFQVLNQALIENTNKEGDFKDENSRTVVIKAIKQGEIFIGKTYDVTNCVDKEHEHE